MSRLIGLPALVLEIGVGILLGPGGAKVVGVEYAVCEQRRFAACTLPPNADQLIVHRQPIGPRLGRIAHMEYCPRNLYLNNNQLESWGGTGCSWQGRKQVQCSIFM